MVVINDLENGDDPPNKDHKGPTATKETLVFAGEYGKQKLNSGEYTKTNGEKGNFNDRPENKLSQRAKDSNNFAKGLKSLHLLGTAGNIYSFGDGA